MTWAWEQPAPTPQAKLALLALADRADEDGVCWPSRRWITGKTGMTTNQLKRALRNLEVAGMLNRKRQRRENGTLGTWLFMLPVSVEEQAVDTNTTVARAAMVNGTNPAKPLQTTMVRIATMVPATMVGEADIVRNFLEGSSYEEPSSEAPKSRAKDELWDALSEALGYTPKPGTSAHGRRNKAVKDLRTQEATVEGVLATARGLRTDYGNPAVTDTAIAAHYLRYADTHSRTPKQTPYERAMAWAETAGWMVAHDDRDDVMPQAAALSESEREAVRRRCDEVASENTSAVA